MEIVHPGLKGANIRAEKRETLHIDYGSAHKKNRSTGHDLRVGGLEVVQAGLEGANVRAEKNGPRGANEWAKGSKNNGPKGPTS